MVTDLQKWINFLNSIGLNEIKLKKQQDEDKFNTLEMCYEPYRLKENEYCILVNDLVYIIKYYADKYHRQMIYFTNQGEYLKRDLSTW